VLAKRKQTHKKIGNSFRFHAIGVLLLLFLEVAASSFIFWCPNFAKMAVPLDC
jgi:hypothetical protein